MEHTIAKDGAVRHCKISTARVQFWLPGPIRMVRLDYPSTCVSRTLGMAWYGVAWQGVACTLRHGHNFTAPQPIRRGAGGLRWLQQVLENIDGTEGFNRLTRRRRGPRGYPVGSMWRAYLASYS